MIYNKLVRDKIPEIIARQGKHVTFRALKGEELKKALKEKLIEETQELVNAETQEQIIEEMADVQEVLQTMRLVLTKPYITTLDLDDVRNEKQKEKGGFEKGYFLESVEEDEQ